MQKLIKKILLVSLAIALLTGCAQKNTSTSKEKEKNTETEVAYAKGLCERIGNTGSNIAHKNLIKGTKTEKIADMAGA